ncbi:hypothetical protein PRVXT_001458 [Proteinivorax tanatarense]|uniref:General stress protein 17M-like domain-containing protein n=1 Tax=Proteinivorax tanatarense TaxID=1260629 RepID=A0AAU7VQ97_9FIRM
MTQKVIGVFSSRQQAEETVKTLRQDQFAGEISVVAKDEQEGQQYQPEAEDNNYRVESNEYRQKYSDTGFNTETSANKERELSFEDQNLTDGTLTGGALGGLAGLAVGAGALIIPGLGPIIAAGPMAGILTGALTGGVAGGLVDYGIPEERSKHYESKVQQGHILVILESDDTEDAASIMREKGAQDVETH